VLPAVKNQTGYCSARIRSEDRKIRRLGRKRNSSGSREERTVIQANDDNKKEIRTGRKSEKQKKGKKIEYQTLMELMLVTVRKAASVVWVTDGQKGVW
jgi:hypothetical protein